MVYSFEQITVCHNHNNILTFPKDVYSIWLHYISEKPTVTLSCPSPVTVNEGDDFTCVCRGEGGNPPANVTWYKDGDPIGGTGNEEQTLTLRNVDGTADTGTYKCVAQSHTLAEEKLVEVKVRQNCKYCCILYIVYVIT